MFVTFQGVLVEFTVRQAQSGTFADFVVLNTNRSGKETRYKFACGNNKGMVDAMAQWKPGTPVLVEAAIGSKQNDKGYWATELWATQAHRLSAPAAQEYAGGY